MEKSIHASVTECKTEVSSLDREEKGGREMIKEIDDSPQASQAKTSPSRPGFQNLHRIPRAIKVLLVVILTGIPFMIFMLVARFALQHKPIGPVALHATYFKLSKWLIICWAALIIIFALAESLARFAAWACQLSTHWVKYAPLANTLCFRVTMLAWAGAAHQANCRIWNGDYQGKDNWPATLKTTFEFLVVSFTIILAQGVVLQLIAIRYVEGYIGPRSKRASNELETIRDLNNLVKRHIEHDDPSYFIKIFKTLFFPVEVNIFEEIASGRANEDTHREYAANIWSTIATNLHKEVLTSADLTNRLKEMGRDPEAAEDLFTQLDESCDGQVTREELEALVVNTGAQLNKRADSMRGIKSLLFKLEILLTVVMFGIIVFIYTNFFKQTWAVDVKALWTGIVGLSFAFGGTVSEFVNSCVFVFAKHAYDVGDLVEAKGKKLIVRDIHLTHTNFEEKKDDDVSGMVVQISHAALSGEPMVNWTRSNDLKLAQKEKDDGCCGNEERRPSITKFAGW